MRKIFNKVLAGATSMALVAALLVGLNITKEVKADDIAVQLANWSFVQGGQFNDQELWNTAYINSVTMNGTNEKIEGWLKGNGNPATSDPSVNQTLSAKDVSTGFAIDIDSNSQDKDWGNDRINAWAIRAEMNDVNIKPTHIYTVSFKAYASKKKYCYVAFGCDVEGTAPYGEDKIEGDGQLLALGTSEKTYTYTFTNWVSAKKLSIALQLGAFNSQYDYAGNDVSDIITAVETMWGGQVYVSDFSITDKGENPDAPVVPDKPSVPSTQGPTGDNNNPTGGQNVTPTTPSTPAPVVTAKKLAKVKKLKAKNTKKGTVKITWKKVAKAKTYQVKVGKKTYTSKKVKLTVKKLKKGKKYTIKVRAKAAGYKAGAWAKTKVKIKK